MPIDSMNDTNQEREDDEISSFTYSTPKPFNAEKLETFINEKENWKSIHKSKGFFWVDADHRIAYQWAQEGETIEFSILGVWVASVGEEKLTDADGQRLDQQTDWDPVFGDREQRILFIGEAMDEGKIRANLDFCLLDDEIANVCLKSLGVLPSIFPSLKLTCDH